jgi:hypothetical protein
VRRQDGAKKRCRDPRATRLLSPHIAIILPEVCGQKQSTKTLRRFYTSSEHFVTNAIDSV